MTKEYTTSLKEAIAELQEVTRKYQSTQPLDLNIIVEATEKSHKLLLRINDAALLTNNLLLRELINNLLFVIAQLHDLAQAEERSLAPPPNELLGVITSSFETFFNKIMSKKRQETFKKVAEFVPCVSSIVHCCETMPYYWRYASRAEKAGMILGATLIVAALALTIASYASPALGAMFVLGLGIMALTKAGSTFYRHVIVSPEQKYDDHLKLKKTVNALDEQKKGLTILAKKLFTENKLQKESLLFKEQFIKPPLVKEKSADKIKTKTSAKSDKKPVARPPAEPKASTMRFPAKLQFSIDGSVLKKVTRSRKELPKTRRSQIDNAW